MFLSKRKLSKIRKISWQGAYGGIRVWEHVLLGEKTMEDSETIPKLEINEELVDGGE